MRLFAIVLLLSDVAAASPCKPDDACWPRAEEWQAFAKTLKGKLVQPKLPSKLDNPFALQDDPGGTQSLGWLDAWKATASAYAVAAESANDVAAAVRFARAHRLRVVVKGTGHDYLGRSTAPDSLLIWTHPMRHIETNDAFASCGAAPVHAVTLEAGARWMDVYRKVVVDSGRYVQGGGCTSVGAAGGFLQGGGFGTWSNRFGIAAASLLEAEIVTADGRRVLANACTNVDLFWALRGGGGGTFGVVTSATLETYTLPEHIGYMVGRITAKRATAYHALLEQFARLYRTHLSNEHWGEHVRLGKSSVDVVMSFVDLDDNAVRAAWQSLTDWLARNRADYDYKLDVMPIPGRDLWRAESLAKHASALIHLDQRPGQPPGQFWWKSGDEELATFWSAYESRWLPLTSFDDPKKLADMLFAATREWGVEMYFNKGQAAASEATKKRDADTAMNPVVLRSAALLISAATGDGKDRQEAEDDRRRVGIAAKIIRDFTPSSGSYVNETSYFEPDWQRSFWGTNYARLLEIKKRWDPDNIFTCHHCVGSGE